jgi:hypothetical protein
VTEADAKYATLPFIGRSLPQTRFATFRDGRRIFHFYKHFGLIDVNIFDKAENEKVSDFNVWLVDQTQRFFGAQLHRSLFFLLSHLHFGSFRSAELKTSDSIFVRDIFIISRTTTRSKYILVDPFLLRKDEESSLGLFLEQAEGTSMPSKRVCLIGFYCFRAAASALLSPASSIRLLCFHFVVPCQFLPRDYLHFVSL